MRFGETFKISLFKFSEYQKLLLVHKFKTFLYVLFLALITLLGTAGSVSPLFIRYGSIEGFVEKEVPQFDIKDGRLSCKPYNMDTKDLYINIDPSAEGEPDIPKGYRTAVCITATDYAQLNNYKVNRLAFKDMHDFGKSSVVNFFHQYEKALLIGGAILVFVFSAMSIAFNSLIYAFLAFVANVIFVHAPVTYGNTYKLTIFGSTFAVLFCSILRVFGLGVVNKAAPIFILFYVIKGLMSCRTDEGIIVETIGSDLTDSGTSNGDDNYPY
ncbi:MAG: DUF1189 family protein [Firmicutes bacterium]|nr:DUF1189 family protein [Bacillota bacterium]